MSQCELYYFCITGLVSGGVLSLFRCNQIINLLAVHLLQYMPFFRQVLSQGNCMYRIHEVLSELRLQSPIDILFISLPYWSSTSLWPTSFRLFAAFFNRVPGIFFSYQRNQGIRAIVI